MMVPSRFTMVVALVVFQPLSAIAVPSGDGAVTGSHINSEGEVAILVVGRDALAAIVGLVHQSNVSNKAIVALGSIGLEGHVEQLASLAIRVLMTSSSTVRMVRPRRNHCVDDAHAAAHFVVAGVGGGGGGYQPQQQGAALDGYAARA